jgi:hypothetical protein
MPKEFVFESIGLGKTPKAPAKVVTFTRDYGNNAAAKKVAMTAYTVIEERIMEEFILIKEDCTEEVKMFKYKKNDWLFVAMTINYVSVRLFCTAPTYQVAKISIHPMSQQAIPDLVKFLLDECNSVTAIKP